VPDVTNQDQATAAAALGAAGFQVTVQQAGSDTVPAGTVIGTNPPAGTPLAKGSPVTLIVSSGPTAVEVPNTVGMTQDEATAALTGRGLSVIVNFGPGQNGRVVAQDPGGGTVPPGSTVSITIGQDA
jgi:eukaryotic-like serine/threonine-protein kinase